MKYDEFTNAELDTLLSATCKIKEIFSEQGFSVRKGEKALLLWRKPKAKQTEEEPEENATEFYPLAFLFSKQQVTQYAQR